MERSADGDDVVVSGSGEASAEFDALALAESMHAAELQQQSLVKGKSSSTTVGQDAKPYQPKGLAHSVRVCALFPCRPSLCDADGVSIATESIYNLFGHIRYPSCSTAT